MARTRLPNLTQEGMGINAGEITMEEIEQAIGAPKKGTTPGPDTRAQLNSYNSWEKKAVKD